MAEQPSSSMSSCLICSVENVKLVKEKDLPMSMSANNDNDHECEDNPIALSPSPQPNGDFGLDETSKTDIGGIEGCTFKYTDILKYLKAISGSGSGVPVTATTLELFELLCHYFRIDATDCPPGIENMTLFCCTCLSIISEIFQLHKIKMAIQADIATRIKRVESFVGSEEHEMKIIVNKPGSGSGFARTFRKQIRLSLLPKLAIKLEKLPDSHSHSYSVSKSQKSNSKFSKTHTKSTTKAKTNKCKNPPVSINRKTTAEVADYPDIDMAPQPEPKEPEPEEFSFSHLSLNCEVEDIQIKVQPEDFSEYDEDVEDALPFLISPETKLEENFEGFTHNEPVKLEAGADFTIPNSNDQLDLEPAPGRRNLRPRRSKNSMKSYREGLDIELDLEESSVQEIRTQNSQFRVKSDRDLLSEDSDMNQEQSADSENDDEFQPDNREEDDPEETFSGSGNSAPDSDDSDSNPEVEDDDDDDWTDSGKPGRKRRRTQNKSKSEVRNRDKTPRMDRGREKAVYTSDGKLLYRDIEITRVETDFGLQFICGRCNGKINVSHKALARQREVEYYRMKEHIRAAHYGAFTCPICSKELRSGKSLSRHVQAHSSSSSPSSQLPKSHCSICQKPFKTSTSNFLRVHEWSHKSEDEKQAAIAEGVKPPKSYREKMEISKQRNSGSYTCPHLNCGKTFVWKSLLAKHQRRVHIPLEERVRNFTCQTCQKSFASKGDLTAHKRAVCEKEKLPRAFFCCHCQKKFYSKDDCKAHERKHTKEKPFKCPKCLKNYTLEKTLKAHIPQCTLEKGVSGGIPYEGYEFFHDDDESGFTLRCGVCEYIVEHSNAKHQRCESYRKMQIHIRGKHLGAYKCSICQKILAEPKGLRLHMKTHDTTSAHLSACETCGKPMKTLKSQNNQSHKLHFWSHLNEAEKQERIAAGEAAPLSYAEKMSHTRLTKSDNLLQCHQCGKTFTWQSQLKKHERVHLGQEGRTHQCAVCGKFYKTADGLLSHTKHVHEKDKIHKWHYCTFCDKKFSHKFSWRKHERSHKRESLKPFQCLNCRKCFSQEKNFRGHVNQCGGPSGSSNTNLNPAQIVKSKQKSKFRSLDSPNSNSNSNSNNANPSHTPHSSLSGNEVEDQQPIMSMPATSSLTNPSLMIQLNQFRQLQQHPNLPQGNLYPGHFPNPGPNPPNTNIGTSHNVNATNNRFYEEGNIYQNFF